MRGTLIICVLFLVSLPSAPSALRMQLAKEWPCVRSFRTTYVLSAAYDNRGDYDGDGVMEIPVDDSVAVKFYSAKTFELTCSIDIPRGYSDIPQVVGFFDFDGDGRKEALLAFSDSAALKIMDVASNKILEVVTNVRCGLWENIVVFDSDSDGYLDLLVYEMDEGSSIWGTLQLWRSGPGNSDNILNPLGKRGVRLGRNAPNPTMDYTVIQYLVRDRQSVEIRIFNTSGELVRTLKEGVVSGARKVIWDGRSNDGNRVPCGSYYYEICGAGISNTRRIIVIR